jgi:hypothetical protein
LFISHVEYLIIEVDAWFFDVIRCQKFQKTLFSLRIFIYFDCIEACRQGKVDEIFNIRSIKSRETENCIVFDA